MTHEEARTLILAVHITAGVAGLLTGPAAMRAAVRTGARTRVTVAYEAAVAVLTASAVALAVMPWGRLWPFAAIAAATAAAVAGARRATQRQWQVRLLCGSYVSLVTALLVVSWGSLAAWLLPSLVGTVLVERAAARVRPRVA